jgi:hypothetical protein
MSQWVEYFEEHQIHQTIQSITELFAAIEDKYTFEPIELEVFERLRQINRILASTLETIDPFFVPKTVLEAINKSVQNQIAQLTAFNNDSNIQHFVAANARADEILVQIRNLFAPQTFKDVEGLREAVSSFRKSVGQHQRNVDEQFETASEKLKSLEERIEESNKEVQSQKSRLDTAISDFQQQFSKAEDSRREQFTKAEKERDEGISGLLETNKIAAADLLSNHQGAFEKFMKSSGSRRKTLEDEFSNSAKEIVSKLELYKTQAENLLQVIGNTGMTGGYQKVANDERDTARKWERIAVGAMAALILFALYAFWLSTHSDFNWTLLGARALVVIPLSVLAGYAAHEAHKHREVERRNRQMELELASINPYLAALPDTTQHDVKRLLAERFFAQREIIKSDGKNNAPSPANIVDIAKIAVEKTIETLAKK